MSNLKLKNKKTSPSSSNKILVQKKKINTPPAGSILQLQQVIGNRGVEKLFHTEKEESLIKKNGNLPIDIQKKMESSFNEDFSEVKIYKNSQEAKKLNARAFTQGNEIHFAAGEFNPNSSKGQEVLGHELSHVVQQRKGLVQATHKENNYLVNDEKFLEQKADIEGKKASRGELIQHSKSSSRNKNTHKFTQKKSQAIQLWRDIPGQARIESTAPNTELAWDVFKTAAREARGGHANSAMPELRRYYYNIISQRMRGSFAPINIDTHTTNEFNHHWQGTITFVFGDTETSLGGGIGSSSLSSASNSSNTLESANSNTTGSSGSANGSFTPGDDGGAGGSVTAGASGSNSNSNKDTRGDSQTSSSTSTIRQQLNRFSSTIGIRVSISGSYDMGSSWTDWINPSTYGAWGMSSILNSTGSSVGICGTVTYYRGAGIAPRP